MLDFVSEASEPLSLGTVILFVVISIVIFIALYIFRAIGLYNLAKRAKEKKIKNIAYFAFIPCIWVYLAVKLAGRISLFGKEVKSYALILTIVFTVGELTMLCYNALCYVPVGIHFLNGGSVFINGTSGANIGNVYLLNEAISLDQVIMPYSDMNKMATALFVISSVSELLLFVSDIMLIFVYIGLFRKYWPQHQTLATILSIFGIFPIMVFVIRKKKPINFQDYMRERYNSMYGAQNPNNFYNGNPNANQNTNPFEDFDNKENKNDIDPFDEFNDKK